MAANKQVKMEVFFQALADRTRLRLLNLMGEDELCVCFFVEVFGTNQPKISRHLAYLRRAGLVSARREGKWMHYRVTEPQDERAAHVFSEVRKWLAEDREMRRDRERLVKICCAPQQPVMIQGAPRPASLSA
ncbi:MAG: metalloregulator ArsR/SmtB family transcription factor [Acidobacteria bacterium]|nr:metalloregulator ArsR/SmtB family transcription factor [Acidobacteriota bacterium]